MMRNKDKNYTSMGHCNPLCLARGSIGLSSHRPLRPSLGTAPRTYIKIKYFKYLFLTECKDYLTIITERFHDYHYYTITTKIAFTKESFKTRTITEINILENTQDVG